MRILVAGWHGQIALALSEAAARREDVTAYAVGRPALDLTDRPSIGRTLFGIAPDVIINTAAYTDVEGAESEPDLAFRRNTIGAAALAGQAARIGVPIIHLSTVYVFDGEKPSAYVEEDTCAPINAYGLSKQAGEAAVSRANDQHIILRTGWIYSALGQNFVTNVLARGRSDEPLQIDTIQRGSPSYAPHIATAVLDIAAAITKGSCENIWGTYHIANCGSASWYDLAREAFRVASDGGAKCPEILPSTMVDSSRRALRPMNAMLDCTKIDEAFGLHLPTWQGAVDDCVRRIISAGS